MIFDFGRLPWHIRKQYKEEDVESVHSALTGRVGQVSYTLFLKNGEKHKYRWSNRLQGWIQVTRSKT